MLKAPFTQQLTPSELSAFLYIADGKGGIYDTAATDRVALYRCRLIKREKAQGKRELTERGKVFLEMLQGTPLPVEVTTPRFVDPRGK